MSTLKPNAAPPIKVMFGSAVLHCSEYQRPFWLTVALSVLLLAAISITIAHAADLNRLAHGLRRDLGALRAQLELVDPWQPAATRQSAAFNADLGDGGPDFQRHSMVTIVGAANRRLERLIDGFRRQGEDARVDAAGELRLAMFDLQRHVDELVRATEPAETVVVREQIGTLLDRAERALSVLLDGPKKPPVLPVAAAQQPSS